MGTDTEQGTHRYSSPCTRFKFVMCSELVVHFNLVRLRLMVYELGQKEERRRRSLPVGRVVNQIAAKFQRLPLSPLCFRVKKVEKISMQTLSDETVSQ